MPLPVLPPSASDVARLIARVEQLERQFRALDLPLPDQELGSAGGVPTDWVEWFLPAGGITGLTYSNGGEDVTWDDSGSSGVTHGGAISLTGGGDAAAQEDGWYVVDGYVFVGATSGTTWNVAMLKVTVNRSFAIGGDVQDIVVIFEEFSPASMGSGPYANLPFHWTGYLLAGDTVHIAAGMDASSDPGTTWSMGDGQFRMEKLPM